MDAELCRAYVELALTLFVEASIVACLLLSYRSRGRHTW